jgi:hypothetical protein
MKNKFKIFYICLLTVFASCSDFGDTNKNPNAPEFVGTETLLTSAQLSVGDVVGSNLGVLYVQHLADITYTESSRYGDVIANFNGWYTGPLANLQKIIDLNTDEATKGEVLAGGSNNNQIGVAMILQGYFYQFITDRWGPLPFTEALKGTEILLPAYDSQQAIYSAVFGMLKNAVSMLDGGSIEGDIILGGDTNEWKKFANTLRANMAIRIADVDPGTAKAEFTSAMSAGLLSDGVAYNYLAEAANQNPWFGRFLTRTDYAISDVFYNYLTGTNDPRLNSFADPAASTGTIQPMPYGLENSDYQPTDVSFPNSTYVRAQDTDIAIFSAAQIHFMMAEAAARGWISDNAETHYNAAIAASMNQWGISDAAAIAAFTAQDGVKYDAANWKKSIGEQKWVALFTQGYEGWAEWRRLDYPVLQPATAPLNPSEGIPLRFIYPESEEQLNGENYNAAVSMLGGNDTDGVRLWWDVN